MRKRKEWFLYKSTSDDEDTMTAVPRGNDPHDQYANMITVTEITAFEVTQLREKLDTAIAALEMYAMTNETFPEYGDTARDALAKIKETEK